MKVLEHFGGVRRLEAFEDSKSEVSFVYFYLLGFYLSSLFLGGEEI